MIVKRIQAFFISTFLVLFLLASSLAAAQTANKSTPTQNLYLRAQKAFNAGEYDTATNLLNAITTKLSKSASDSTLSFARNLKGLIFLQNNQNYDALHEFRIANELAASAWGATSEYAQLAKYNLAQALVAVARPEEAFELLSNLEAAELAPEISVRYFHLFGKTSSEVNEFKLAIYAFLQTADLLESHNSSASKSLLKRSFEISKKLFVKDPSGDVEYLEGLRSKFVSNSAGQLTLDLIIARGYSYLGKKDVAEKKTRTFLADASSTHPLTASAESMLFLLKKLALVHPNKVGLLLPLSGRFSKYGKLSLNAALLALRALEEDKSGANISFVIRDSGVSEASALKAFERLVIEDQVVAVIGPLLSRQSFAVAQRAQEYSIPTFSLSRKHSSDEIGNFVFPIALSPRQQVEMLTKHAINTLGFRKFAILAPDEKIGNHYVNLFWDIVEESGGAITGYEVYQPKSTDFRKEIKKLLGLHYLSTRNLEMEELKKAEEKYASTLKTKGALRRRLLQKFKPKPVIDFDAVFVPDGPQVIGQIAPSFAIYDATKIPFLGLNTWNTEDIIRRAGKYLQSSYFVDAFHLGSTKSAAKSFSKDFSDAFGSIPGTLEVQSYDAAKILIDLIEIHRPENRTELRNLLISKDTHSGVSGTFKFTQEGTKRNAFLLGVKGSEIVELPSRQ